MAQVFPCELCEISKNTLLQNTSGRLLLLFLKMTLALKLKATCKLKAKAFKNACEKVLIYFLILWVHSFLNWFNIWKCVIKMASILYLNFPIILTNKLSFDSAIYFKTKLFCFLLLSLDKVFFIDISYQTSQSV